MPTQPASVPALPAPPLLERLLFENPWPAIGALLAAALVAAWLLNKQSRAREGLLAAGGLAVLALAVYIASAVVTTQREVLAARTRELINLTAAADTTGLEPLMARDVTFRAFLTQQSYQRDAILDLVRRYPGQMYPVKSHRIDRVQATIDGPNAARTQTHVTTESPEATLYNLPTGSWWRLNWRKDPDGQWRLTGIELLQVDGVSPDTRYNP